MTALVPPQFLFRYTFPVRRIDALPRRGKELLKLADDCVLPSLAELGRGPRFAEVRVAWNDHGLGLSISVDGKQAPPVFDAGRPAQSDAVHLWIDTRNTQSIHRASRFCHQFQLIPAVTNDQTGELEARCIPHPIARAKEDAPRVDADLIPAQSHITRSGYRMDVWLPQAVLHGYDPSRQSKLGFFYAVADTERGLQTLSVGSEFPFGTDPSLWSTLELV